MSGGRTISQIAGEFGLNKDSTKDPFAAQEKAVTEQVGRQLEESQSRQLESAASRGFGRSSFTEGAFAREREGVSGALGTQFAKARTDEALRKRGFERDIISTQLGADVQSRLLAESSGEQRKTLTQQLAGETGLIGTRGEQQRLTQATGAQAQSDLLTQQLAGETGLIGTRAEQQRLNQEIAAQTQSNLLTQQAELNAQQNLLGREFSAQENQLQRDFQLASQQAGFDQQTSLIDQQRQDNLNQQALDLVLRGNVSQEEVQDQIGNLLGEGAVLTTDDEATLQRIASASGLSVEDYTRLRSAIGTAQGATILGTHKGEIPKTNDAGEELFFIGDDRTYDRLGITRGTEITAAELAVLEAENGAIGTRPSTVTGDVSNINNFIQDPEAAKQFQLQLADIQAKAQVDVAEEQAKKVLCTELYSQGRLPFDILMADNRHASKIHPDVVAGYHYWAKPLVKVMQRSELVTNLLSPFITAWAYQMAYRENVVKESNRLGRLLEAVGMPICRLIGIFTKRRLKYGTN